jgi:hypothetical protein
MLSLTLRIIFVIRNFMLVVDKVQIKDFGNNVDCLSMSELTDKLRSDYTGKSVSLVLFNANTLKGLKYIDVKVKGEIVNSYSSSNKVLDDIFFIR